MGVSRAGRGRSQGGILASVGTDDANMEPSSMKTASHKLGEMTIELQLPPLPPAQLSLRYALFRYVGILLIAIRHYSGRSIRGLHLWGLAEKSG